MGAEVFQNYSQGKDAASAYKKAVEEAFYHHGHGGYTGSIAEKGGYEVFECPSDITASQLMDWTENYDMGGKYIEAVPEKYRPLVARMSEIFEDKWGPAVCIELKGAELVDARKKFCINNNIKKTSMRFFLFGGWASS